MDARSRLYLASGATAGLFLLIQLGALALVKPFMAAGYRAVENPSDPTNSLVYLVAILVVTGFILLVIKLGVESILRVVVTLMSAVLSLYVFSVVVPPVVVVSGINVLAWASAGVLALALFVYPEWYVIDAAGVVIAAGGAGLFGISFGPLPAILLLGALAVYDAVSVYRTKHMLTLAESVTGLKLPLVLIIPLSLSYSFRDAGAVGGGPADRDDEDSGSGDDANAEADEDERSGGGSAPPPDEPEGAGIDRDAFYVGLGDTVMPTILVASAAFFVDAPSFGLPAVAMNSPALGAMVGTFVGVAGLLYLVSKGRAHAGLPLLNGGAIAGYLLGALLAGIPLVEALGLTPYL